MGVTVEPLSVHRDGRGSVFEPLPASAIGAQRNVHVVMTEPGAVRGNHVHDRGTEVLVASGPALLRTREAGNVRDTVVPAGAVYRITISPGVAHAVRNTGAQPSVLVAFRDVPHDPARPDTRRVVLLEPARSPPPGA